MKLPPRVVFDTNVVVSTLVFQSGALAWLRAAWADGTCLPLASRATVTKLLRVLEYPKFELSADERNELLGDYLPCCEVVTIAKKVASVPRCRDLHDRPFLELAVAGKANALVTGDRDLLAVRGETRFSIVTPVDFEAFLRDERPRR